MGTPVWSDVRVAVQTVLGAAITLTGITKANPGVASAASHGLLNGELIVMSVPGIPLLDNRVVRVSGAAAGTFNLEGIDTTGMPDFVSGSVRRITFGAVCNTLQDMAGSGGETTPTTWNTIHTRRTFSRPGFEAPMRLECTSLRDIADPALIELRKAHSAMPKDRAFEVVFDDGSKVYFYGSVNAPMTLGGSSGTPVTTPVSIDVLGLYTDYAS